MAHQKKWITICTSSFFLIQSRLKHFLDNANLVSISQAFFLQNTLHKIQLSPSRLQPHPTSVLVKLTDPTVTL